MQANAPSIVPAMAPSEPFCVAGVRAIGSPGAGVESAGDDMGPVMKGFIRAEDGVPGGSLADPMTIQIDPL